MQGFITVKRLLKDCAWVLVWQECGAYVVARRCSRLPRWWISRLLPGFGTISRLRERGRFRNEVGSWLWSTLVVCCGRGSNDHVVTSLDELCLPRESLTVSPREQAHGADTQPLDQHTLDGQTFCVVALRSQLVRW